MRPHRILPTLSVFAFLLLTAAMPARAQVETVTTSLQRTTSPAQVLGSRYRQNVDRALRATAEHDLPKALDQLHPVITFCDDLISTGHKLVSVTSDHEYTAYVASFGEGEPVDWVDMACPEAYKALAFINVEKKDIEAAFTALNKSIRLAPYWAEPLAERGYLLGQTGKLEEGLASYRAALTLSETHESNRPLLALALRGIGYIQTELGALEAAEQAYRRSLEIDPESQVAKNELEYIRRQRAKAQP